MPTYKNNLAINQWHIHMARHVLDHGGVIAYPTEAVFGLGCDPFNAEAVEQLLALKARSINKGLILVAASMRQIAPFIAHLSKNYIQQLQQSWPGPITWLVPDNGRVPIWIKGQHDSVALRVTAHPVVQQLCMAFGGPIVSTSANPSTKPAARTLLAVHQYFKGRLDYIVPGMTAHLAKPTLIRDLMTGNIVRAAQ